MKKLLFSFLLLTITLSAFSQRKGYVGRIHQVQVDLGRVYWGYYQAEYKISPWKHFGFAFTGGMINTSVKYKDEYFFGPSIDRLTFNGGSFGGGIVYNSPYAGAPMPVGFYSGIYFIKSWGSLSELVSSKSVYNRYDLKGNLVKFYYGRTFVLHKFLTLDLGIGTGIYWGKTIPIDRNEEPVRLIPSTLFFQKSSETDFAFSSYYGYGSGVDHYGFIKYYFMPEVKIGYMF